MLRDRIKRAAVVEEQRRRAAPFQGRFTRQDLHKLLAKVDAPQPTSLAA
jgi:hypothetical protein